MHAFVALAIIVANPEATALREEGTRLFRAKSFAAACAKFEAAARLVPDDPEPLADLALCRQRLGHDDRARELNEKVIALASTPPARRGDKTYARHRRHAYFNLDRLDKGPREGGGTGKDREQDCGPLEAGPACAKPLHACTVSKTGGGSGRLVYTTHVRMAATPETARFSEGDIVDLHEDVDFGRLGKPGEPTPVHVAAGGSIEYVESFREEGRDHQCDDKEWSCDESEAVGAATLACIDAAQAKDRAKLPAAFEPGCRKQACARATAKPWPAVRREQKVIDKGQSDCFKTAQSIDGEYGCRVVHANACTGLVGLVCAGREGGAKKTRTRVEEYLFDVTK